MMVSINQPAYLPWLGYFHRIHISDVHVILDHVQFEKNSFTNRNKIRLREGSTILTIPLKTKGLFGDLAINSIEVANDIWRIKHFKSIQQAYSKAPFYKKYEQFLTDLYSKPFDKLIDVILPMNYWFMEQFQTKTTLLRSSEMQIEGTKSELVLDICKQLNATSYLSGPFGRDYLDLDSFEKAGIKVLFDDYKHPVYEQLFPGFEPYMSSLDLLLNHGDDSLKYILNS